MEGTAQKGTSLIPIKYFTFALKRKTLPIHEFKTNHA
jgi:hypothetical protein